MALSSSNRTKEGGERDNNSGQFENVPSESGMALASRILAKMGYQTGEGLGKGGKGIADPLIAGGIGGGVSKSMGDIERDRKRQLNDDSKGVNSDGVGSSSMTKKGGFVRFSNPSCVVLLKNMVGPDDVVSVTGM